MCGIAGQWRFHQVPDEPLSVQTATMVDTLRHRGPDDRGVWTDGRFGVALANRRLAVVDLSPGGRQPMVSADGRVVLAFNGELYNHRELRRTLEAEGVRFRSQSDTEVLVELIARRGLRTALDLANAMFAMAVWMRDERALHLARDRFGEKPLYWALTPAGLLFGSELKALRAHPEFQAEPDRASVSAFLRWSHIPAPATILKNVWQVRPGWCVRIDGERRVDHRQYWSILDVASAGSAAPPADPVGALQNTLGEAVRMRMLADVPVGLFLSGGIDSSLVAALAQSQSGSAIRTLSIGFAEASHDESAAAAAVARHLGTRHEALRVTADDALRVIPELPDIYDEPLADSSQIPTLLLARLARRDVTVALTGDGGDELFGGYNRHVWADRLGGLRGWMPGGLRHSVARLLATAPPDRMTHLSTRLAWMPRQMGDKLGKVSRALTADSPEELYASILARWPDPSALLPEVPTTAKAFPARESLVEGFMLADTLGYLPDDVLVKVDRATMAASLESRAPFLDPNVAALAWSLPLGQRVEGGRGKVILRRLLSRFVPPTLFERPKAGFTVPLGNWLRGPLRPWLEELIAPAALEGAGLRPGPVQAAWDAHRAGRANAAEQLWTVATYIAWTRRWLQRQGS